MRKRLKRIWHWLWKESFDELIFGNQAKHKQPVGISWLNVHRLFDYRWMLRIQVRLDLWRQEKGLPAQIYPARGVDVRTPPSYSGVREGFEK